MNKSQGYCCVIALSLSLGLNASTAFSADKDQGKDQVKRLQQMQQKLTQEKAALTREKALLEGQVKESSDKLGEAQQAAKQAAGRNATLKKELTAAQEEKQKLASDLAEMTEASRKFEAEGQQLKANLARLEKSTASCEAKNVLLYGYGNELLARYEGKGVWAAVTQAEPFTQLKRVEIENVVEEYRDKLDAQKIQAPSQTVRPAR